MATVQTLQGPVKGNLLGEVLQYRGIPYAQTPCSSEARFLPPKGPRQREGVLDAARSSEKVPQVDTACVLNPRFKESCGDGSEYLTLNIWAPKEAESSQLPVLVYICGGSFLAGDGGEEMYDCQNLAAKGIVAVTINYRVGFEGFGHIPGRPDNRGLMDIIAALHWVKDNIAGFGGNPANVSAAGHSAGATAIMCLLCIPLARGTFQRAILHSPTAFTLTPSAAFRVTEHLAATCNVAPTLAGISSVPVMDLAKALLGLRMAAFADPSEWGIQAFFPIAPVVDGDILPHAPMDPVAAEICDIDILVGYTKDEAAFIVEMLPWLKADPKLFPSLIGFPQVLEAMKQSRPDADDATVVTELVSDWINRGPALRIAGAHASRESKVVLSATSAASSETNAKCHPATQEATGGAQTHCYVFAAALPPGAPAIHGLDCPYAFGNLTAKMMGRQMLGPDPPPECYELSEAMQKAWVSFCHCGNPRWGCAVFTSEEPVQRVWVLPDVAGTCQLAPLEEHAKIWGDLNFGPQGAHGNEHVKTVGGSSWHC